MRARRSGSRSLAFSLALLLPLCSSSGQQKAAPTCASAEAECAALPASEAPRRLRADVEMVLVPVTVTNPAGQLVNGLGPAHFRIFEDGVEQELLHVFKEETPISVALLVDTSGSMRNQMDAAKQMAVEFLQTANPHDEFMMVEFAERARMVSRFTDRVENLQSEMAVRAANGDTALLDGVYLGATQMRSARNKRRALVLLTDGEDNHSRYNEEEVKRLLQETDAQFYAIGRFTWLGRRLMSRLVDITGGRMFHDYDPSQTTPTIWEALRNQYVLAYAPGNRTRDGAWRKIKVKVRPDPGMPPLAVYAKAGYLAPQ